MAVYSVPTFTPQDNFKWASSTYDTTYRNFGLTVYKNYDSYQQKEICLNDHISDFVEMCCGAHYYSSGKYTNLYRKAKVAVNLDQITVDTKGRRAACDLGLKNVGGGWYSFYYCHKMNAQQEGTVVSGATKVKMLLETNRQNNMDVIKISYTWYNSSGAQIHVTGNNASLIFSEDAGTIFGMYGGLPMHRFQRFMSLVPLSSYIPTEDIMMVQS